MTETNIIKYKTIKIPEPTYNAIKKAQIELANVGIRNIPDEIVEKCPFCDTTLNSVAINYQYAECPKCHYQHQTFNIGTKGTLAIGIIVGIGVAAFIYSMRNNQRDRLNS